MPKIKVDTTGVIELRGTVVSTRSQASDAISYIAQARNGIDMNTAASENVSYRINRLYARMQAQQTKLSQYENCLTRVNEQFTSSDRSIANQAKEINYLLDQILTAPFIQTRNFLDIEAEKMNLLDLLCLFTNGSTDLRDILWTMLSGAGALSVLYNIIHGIDDNVDTFNSIYADNTWFGAEYNSNSHKLDGWIWKEGTEVDTDSYYAGVNGYLGKVEAKADTDASLFKTETKREYEDGKWVEKDITTLINIAAEAGISGSILAGDAKVSTGDDMLGVEAKAEGSVGNASAEAKGRFSVGEDGVNAYVKGEAIVSAVEGKASGTINILGIEITVKASGYAGAVGVEGEVGVKNGKFVLEGGGAAGIGGSLGIEIGLNEEGWDNFVDFITFWD